MSRSATVIAAGMLVLGSASATSAATWSHTDAAGS